MDDANAHRTATPQYAARLPLPMGTRIDHYVLKDVLGAGGFGITYLAVHEALGKNYAIKEYFPGAFSYREGVSVRASATSAATYQWGLERFITEARALARFKHPAIVDVTSVFEANGTAYIVLAYEAGRNMSDWLKQLGRRPTQTELDRIVAPLLSALEEIHQHNILHRDIAPDNLLIRDNGMPVLIDFGSARESVRGHSRALSMIVKQGYSPPEQYSNKPGLQGAWTDIYALAATLYRAVSGTLPPEATERFLKDDIQPIEQLAKGSYRLTFLRAIDKGLNIKTQHRPQTIADWRQMLLLAEPERPMPPAREPIPAAASASELARKQLAEGDPVESQAAGTDDASQHVPPPHVPRTSDGRPDLSWLDEHEEAQRIANSPAPMLDHPQVRGLWYGVLGLIAGALAGALFSIVLASVLSSSCFADSCITAYLRICSLIGAVAGGLIGVRIGRMEAESETRKLPDNRF